MYNHRKPESQTDHHHNVTDSLGASASSSACIPLWALEDNQIEMTSVSMGVSRGALEALLSSSCRYLRAGPFGFSISIGSLVRMR